MKSNSPLTGRTVLAVVTLLTLAALACGAGLPGGNSTATPAIDFQATAAALQATADALAQAETQQAQVPPTAPALPTAPPEDTQAPEQPTQASGPQSYVDDFSSDKGNWEVFSNDVGSAQISDGVLLLGPFNECTDVGQNSGPFGCFSQCLACGVVSEYDIQVDAAYISGRTDQTFGMVLRFQDANNNGLVDKEDYFLDFELSIYDQSFYVFEHLAGAGITDFPALDSRTETNIASGTQVNTLRAVSTNGGVNVDLYLNGTGVETITLDQATSSGTVGLVVGFRNMQAGFDNFQITLP